MDMLLATFPFANKMSLKTLLLFRSVHQCTAAGKYATEYLETQFKPFFIAIL